MLTQRHIARAPSPSLQCRERVASGWVRGHEAHYRSQRRRPARIHGHSYRRGGGVAEANDPDAVYEALQDYFDGDITKAELDTRLQALARTGDIQGPTPVPLAQIPSTFAQVGQTSGDCVGDDNAPYLRLDQIKARMEWFCETGSRQWVLVQRPEIDRTPYNVIEQLAKRANPNNVCSRTVRYTVPSTPPSWWTSAGSWSTNIGGKTYTVNNLNFDLEQCREQKAAQYGDPSKQR